MKKIEKIVVHCSDSEWGTAFVINEWHKQRGWSRVGPDGITRSIGYLGVIGNGRPFAGMDKPWYFSDGAWEWGRGLDDNAWLDPDETEAQTLGWNGRSVGFCLIGKPDKITGMCNFTPSQLSKAKTICNELISRLGLKSSDVMGHKELQAGKVCPGMDMDVFRDYVAGIKDLGVMIDSLTGG